MTRSRAPRHTLPEETFALTDGGHVTVALPEALSQTE